MPARSSKDHDFAVNARRVVEQAIGEHLDGAPLENPDAGKNPVAVALGRLGGAKGGLARAAALSPVSGVNYFSLSTTIIFPYRRQLQAWQNGTPSLHWC
jgi:hypothetical protein